MLLKHASSTSHTKRKYRYRRHSAPVRVMHWINVVALTILLMSGLKIFNAYPELHWGQSSYNGRPPLLQLGAQQLTAGSEVGVTHIFGRTFLTTGVLGLFKDPYGELTDLCFHSWGTSARTQWLPM